jgi:hypothetical protein
MSAGCASAWARARQHRGAQSDARALSCGGITVYFSSSTLRLSRGVTHPTFTLTPPIVHAVLAGGRVIERGSHEALLAQHPDGTYASLLRHQMLG